MPRTARYLRIRGVVQGVGFRPFVYRLARANALDGWVLNAGDGVEIHVEGSEDGIATFLAQVETAAPPAAAIAAVDVTTRAPEQFGDFVIRESVADAAGAPVHLSPDLPACADCIAEMRDPAHRLHGYPYINCTNCGPRFSIVHSVPYDRQATTMAEWPMCDQCAAEYHDPRHRRFHAQPVACPECGPGYRLLPVEATASGVVRGDDDVADAALALGAGAILAIKGIGGYHLACDARNAAAVNRLRTAKFRKAKPFAVMVSDIGEAERLAVLSPTGRSLLTSSARPIVVVPARDTLAGVAPGTTSIGLMLPYTPLHQLLFDHGAPRALVMTSANRSSEPIAFRDDDALDRLGGIADAFLLGAREIARRVDDSVVRPRGTSTMMLRRSRGHAPRSVAAFPSAPPILGVGGDLKNSVTLAVGGEAFTSQYIGDLDQADCLAAFRETIDDLLSMHNVDRDDLVIAADLHPQYRSSLYAADLSRAAVLVQHHEAHIASVLAEHAAFDQRVIGIACDGTGFGADGAIWGGEFFSGSVADGFRRAAHLRQAALVGGDAAATFPAQAAAGFVAELPERHLLGGAPFALPERFDRALQALTSGTRLFQTTSIGRLFDAAAALTGFTNAIDFEGQAAIWLEELAQSSAAVQPYPFPLDDGALDYRPLLGALIRDRFAGRNDAEIARAFHAGVAMALANTALTLAQQHDIDTIAVSGGVFQNLLLIDEVERRVVAGGCRFWTNAMVPVNDGGLSLGQAAIAAVRSAPYA